VRGPSSAGFQVDKVELLFDTQGPWHNASHSQPS
jgi:hypothetical protein